MDVDGAWKAEIFMQKDEVVEGRLQGLIRSDSDDDPCGHATSAKSTVTGINSA